MNNIGKLIRERRTELKLTLEEVGKAVGVSKSTVKKWEDGDISNMRRDKIASLSRVLRINPVSLINGKLVLLNQNNDFYLTNHEKEIIIAYRKQFDMQEAVDRLLGVTAEQDRKEKHA